MHAGAAGITLWWSKQGKGYRGRYGMMGEALFLLVDDDEEDILLVRRAFTRARITNPLGIVRSGEEAVAYLRGEGRYSDRAKYPLPALVLLDIKMRGMDGLGVLAWIRHQPDLRGLRVVMVTSSDDMRHISRAYQLGVNSFLIKPLDFERFTEISQALGGHWIWGDKAPEPLDSDEVKGTSDTEILRREVRAQP